MDDEALVQRCLSGDTEAFGELVSRYERPLFNVALRMLRDREEARDATQNAFVKALQRSLPGLPLPTLLWRFEFVWGALAFTLCNPRKIEVETHGACNPANTEKVLAEMMQFFSAGFHARPRAKVNGSARRQSVSP